MKCSWKTATFIVLRSDLRMTKAALYISLPANEHGHGEELRFEGELFGYPMSTTGELVFQVSCSHIVPLRNPQDLP